MNAKIAAALALLCLTVAAQSIHLHPNGRQLVFSMGTNGSPDFTIDRHYCWNRIRRFEAEAAGLKDQVAFAEKCVREYPSRISALEKEIETQRNYLRMMDMLGVTNTPTIIASPPELPTTPNSRSGVPESHRALFIPQRHVMTARE